MAEKVMAHIHSRDGEMGEVHLLGRATLFGHPIQNCYIFKVGDVLCTGVYNCFVNAYYVDDKYGVLTVNDENYSRYAGYLKGVRV